MMNLNNYLPATLNATPSLILAATDHALSSLKILIDLIALHVLYLSLSLLPSNSDLNVLVSIH